MPAASGPVGPGYRNTVTEKIPRCTFRIPQCPRGRFPAEFPARQLPMARKACTSALGGPPAMAQGLRVNGTLRPEPVVVAPPGPGRLGRGRPGARPGPRRGTASGSACLRGEGRRHRRRGIGAPNRVTRAFAVSPALGLPRSRSAAELTATTRTCRQKVDHESFPSSTSVSPSAAGRRPLCNTTAVSNRIAAR